MIRPSTAPRSPRLLPLLLAANLFAGLLAAGTPVRVTVRGKVDFNSISAGALGMVSRGEDASLTFMLDSASFVNSTSFPTRGYRIDPGSLRLKFASATLGLAIPLPGGVDPLFVLRDNDPAVDGFFVSTNVDFPVGVPLEQTGVFGPFVNDFSVTYGGGLLSSLDILAALGTYDFTGLTVYNWTIDDGPAQPMGIRFVDLTIETYYTNTVCPAELPTDPMLADNGGNPEIGPKLGNPAEPFDVQLDCSGVGSPGVYLVELRPKAAMAGTSSFGSLWLTGPLYLRCMGMHAQSVVTCFPGGLVIPNLPVLVGFTYGVQGFCGTATGGRTSNALIQTIGQ